MLLFVFSRNSSASLHLSRRHSLARSPIAAQRMSTLGAGQYLCQICLNHKNIRDRVFLTNCGHSFCRSCMRMFVEAAVLEVRNWPAT